MHRRVAIFVLLAVSAAACGGPPPPPPPTIVNVTVTGSDDVNAGAGGKGEPVAVRIYQLASPTGFKAATFYPLFEKDAAALKDDLVKREDVLLAPGQTKTLVLTPEDRVHAIGVFAGYRDFDRVTWRDTVAVPAHQTSDLTVAAARDGLSLVLKPEKPPVK